MKTEIISSSLIRMANHKYLRKLLAKKADRYIYDTLVNGDSQDLKEVQLKKYQFLSAMLHCVIRSVDKGFISSETIKKVIKVLVENNLVCSDQSYFKAVERFKEK